MGSKERILRLKDDTRRNILDTAFHIVQTEGWNALNMRKLADQIACTAPVIYEYFRNKECIYTELERRGHLILADKVRAAKNTQSIAEKQILAMWIAYWDFAFTHKAFYQLMYGIDIVCFSKRTNIAEANFVTELMTEVIKSMFIKKPVNPERLLIKYYSYWSAIHGLIALNIIQKSIHEEMYGQIFLDAIKRITASINTST
jgi:AcrR family transcriptional regulator